MCVSAKLWSLAHILSTLLWRTRGMAAKCRQTFETILSMFIGYTIRPYSKVIVVFIKNFIFGGLNVFTLSGKNWPDGQVQR